MTALVPAACSRVSDPDGEQRIQFTVPGLFQAQVDTKAAEVTSLAEFHVGCVTGTLGVSEVEVWNTLFTTSGGETPVYVSDKYWPGSDQGYKFYASNMPLTPSATGYTVWASNATDVVCAVLADPGYATTNVLSFEHVFSRLGNVTVEAFPGYTITGISITITPKTGGTYNLRTKTWSGMTTGSATTIANSTPGTRANDLYTVPGIYTLTASWTATDSGSNAVTYSNRTVDVELEKGVVNNATITLGGNITVGVSLEEYVFNDYLQGLEPLTFEALGNGNILWKTNGSWVARTIEYSKDGGITWTSITATTSGAAIPVNTGDKVLVRGNNTEFSFDGEYYCSFSGDVNYYVYGNMTDLLAPGYKCKLTDYCFAKLFYRNNYLRSHPTKPILLPSLMMGEYCYSKMFSECGNLTTAPQLPATTLARYCYQGMFQMCSNLTMPPELPATKLASSCYSSMFQNCTSLTTAPALPATALANYCYSSMFNNCKSLTAAPELPATALANSCYSSMFFNCTSLTSAPSILPATILADSCYSSMFSSCTSLSTAPELPASKLVNNCYSSMFYNCWNLEYIKALFTTTPSNTYTRNWVWEVAYDGVFVKADNATWDVTGTNGIPDDWVVYTESQWL